MLLKSVSWRTVQNVMRLFTLLSLTFGNSKSAWACASCSSGGDEGLILFPNEEFKIGLALGRSSNFANMDGQGRESSAGAVVAKETIRLSAGYQPILGFFAVIGVPFVSNVGHDFRRSGLGDPMFTARYTLLQQTFVRPLIPQVQVYGGYKHSISRSLHDTNDLKYQSDVYGNGFSESRIGVDSWYGMSRVRAGLAALWWSGFERTFSSGTYKPGVGIRLTATIGAGWTSKQKSVIGVYHDEIQALEVNGTAQSSLGQKSNSLFMAHEWMTTENESWRLSASRQGAFGIRTNTTVADAMSLMYLKAI
jgi:hypothetical protein